MRDLYSNDVATAAYLAGESAPAMNGPTVSDVVFDEYEPLTECPWCGAPLVTEGPHAGECPNHGRLSPDGP